MELHLGLMKNAELAEWFGIAKSSMTQHKKKKLEELKQFADFEEVYGGVNILKIKEKNYVKDSQKKKALIKEKFMEEWGDNNLDTCANVARKMLNKYPIELKEKTLENYIRNQRTEYFGKPFISDGSLGSCKLLWTKAIPVQGEPNLYVCIKLTPEEEKIKSDLLMKYYATRNADEIERKMFVKDMVDTGFLTKEEGFDALCDVDNLNEVTWKQFLMEFKAKVGGQLVKTTELLVGQYLHKEDVLELKEGIFNFE